MTSQTTRAKHSSQAAHLIGRLHLFQGIIASRAKESRKRVAPWEAALYTCQPFASRPSGRVAGTGGHSLSKRGLMSNNLKAQFHSAITFALMEFRGNVFEVSVRWRRNATAQMTSGISSKASSTSLESGKQTGPRGDILCTIAIVITAPD